MASHSEASIGVVGGGIGGLTAALALLRAGFDVQVYEQASGLREIGAGVQVSPNASRVLHGLGLAEPLAATGVRPLAWHQRRWDDGRTLLRTPLGRRAGGGLRFPPLPDAPRRPARRAGRGGARRAGPSRASPDRAWPIAATASRRGSPTAAGSRSTRWSAPTASIRSCARVLFGPERPRFTGCVAYRGLVPAERLRAPGARGDRAGLDGAGPALRPLLRPSRGGS